MADIPGREVYTPYINNALQYADSRVNRTSPPSPLWRYYFNQATANLGIPQEYLDSTLQGIGAPVLGGGDRGIAPGDSGGQPYPGADSQLSPVGVSSSDSGGNFFGNAPQASWNVAPSDSGADPYAGAATETTPEDLARWYQANPVPPEDTSQEQKPSWWSPIQPYAQGAAQRAFSNFNQQDYNQPSPIEQSQRDNIAGLQQRAAEQRAEADRAGAIAQRDERVVAGEDVERAATSAGQQARQQLGGAAGAGAAALAGSQAAENARAQMEPQAVQQARARKDIFEQKEVERRRLGFTSEAQAQAIEQKRILDRQAYQRMLARNKQAQEIQQQRLANLRNQGQKNSSNGSTEQTPTTADKRNQEDVNSATNQQAPASNAPQGPAPSVSDIALVMTRSQGYGNGSAAAQASASDPDGPNGPDVFNQVTQHYPAAQSHLQALAQWIEQNVGSPNYRLSGAPAKEQIIQEILDGRPFDPSDERLSDSRMKTIISRIGARRNR